MRWVITWFCDVTGDIRLHSVRDFCALFQYNFTYVTMASGGTGNFPEYKIKFYDFKPLAASDITESFEFGSFGACN